jgi:hypothetical protein
VVLGVLALSACERREAAAPAPEAARFSHRLSDDISGEYRPVGREGDQLVASLFVGQEQAFAAWEAGRRDSPPLILSLTGPQDEVRVTLKAYSVTDSTVQMTGATPDGGAVQLQARLDQGALATARRNLGDQTPVITGSLTRDGRRALFALGWWGGD